MSGTKLGCGEGGCGACTVMLSSYDKSTDSVTHRAVNACLFPLYACEGQHVVTVEGLGAKRSGLHPVQRALARAHGSQCGFCTPGFVMSMYALLRSSETKPTEHEIEEALGGNLCRCTGYRPILRGFAAFARDAPDSAYSSETIGLRGPTGGMDGAVAATSHQNGHAQNGHARANGHAHANGCDDAASGLLPGNLESGPICPSTGLPCVSGCGSAGGHTPAGKALGATEPDSVTAVREPIFPPELKRREARALTLPGANTTWHRPATLAGLLALKKAHPDAKLVCGNTEVGVETKFKCAKYSVVVAPTHVPELTSIVEASDGRSVTFGASTTLTRLERFCAEREKTLPSAAASPLTAIREQLRWFAGPQVRNVSSIGGNVCTASPISDLNPLWIACGATFTVESLDRGARAVPAATFFKGYRTCDIKPDEVLRSVTLPLTAPGEYVREFKQSHRREDDIAIVTAGMRAKFDVRDGGTPVVTDLALGFGGMSFKTVACPETAKAMIGKPWTYAAMEEGLAALARDLPMADDVPGGMPEFRRSLAKSFFFKFFVDCARRLINDGLLPQGGAMKTTFGLEDAELSSANRFHRPPLRGAQYFQVTPAGEKVGQPTMHQSAEAQVTGEAEYCDDVAKPAGCLHAALVTSTHAHAKLLSVDASAALAMPGVVGYYGAADVPGDNHTGPVVHDEEVFASETVTCVGHQIGIVVAETQDLALEAARMVKVEYEPLPAILSIEDAIAANSFHEYPAFTDHAIEDGDVDAAMAGCEAAGRVVSGTARCGGQEHFYLEPNSCLVWCGDNDEVVTLSSTQCPQKHQKLIAGALGLPCNKVVCKTKRLGGGFGGKETRAAFLNVCASVPAYHLRRPVSLVLDRHVDMAVTGQRHPFLGRYKVGFDASGKILALDLELFNNAGNSLDLSAAIMDRALFHSDGAYKIPNFRARGKCCKTNLPSNTAFRGFGGPQGVLFAEMWMDRVARTLGRTAEEVREANLYEEGEACHFGQVMESSQLRNCWTQATKGGVGGASYAERRAAVAAFNAANAHRKRGLAATPVKFGISFTALFMNQAGALVHCYLDGTVLVTHGGVEMGQGLHTKVAQVCAQALGVPTEKVYVAETSTDKVPNASPTAASASSDLYGAAVLDACRQINERLEPVKAALGPEKAADFGEVCNAAYFRRVDLSAHGWYVTPDLEWEWDGSKGRPFNYFCFGAALSEVEIDCLSGDVDVRSTDIVMDVGDSINPALDVGQVEGGFVQGMGWLALEELKFGDGEHRWIRPGSLFTAGPGTYKIPTANDVPTAFNVTLLHDAPNPRAVASSKAVGEPPFLLANSVFFAVKDAAHAARTQNGMGGDFELDAPATPERVRMACGQKISDQFENVPETFRAKLSC